MDNLTGPLSRRVTHEDRQGIETLFNAAADAYQAAQCDGEQLRAILTAIRRAERKDVSRAERRTPHFLSDSIAMVLVETSVTRNGDALGSYTSAILVIKKEELW